MNEIKTENLTYSDIPTADAKWNTIVVFASTFPTKEVTLSLGSPIQSINDIAESASIIDCRMALYAEWRRYNHYGYPPSRELVQKANLILERMKYLLSTDA